jgi:hypothetical protein
MFVTFRPLEAGDERAVLSLFERRSDYFEAATGSPPGPADVQSLFYALPDGASDGQKRVMAIVSDAAVVGVIDAIVDFPEPGTVSVGLFMVDPASGMRGFGMPIATLACERALAEGITTVRVGCPTGWARGEALLGSLGFQREVAGPVPANRVIHPGETEIARWVARLRPPPAAPRLDGER